MWAAAKEKVLEKNWLHDQSHGDLLELNFSSLVKGEKRGEKMLVAFHVYVFCV